MSWFQCLWSRKKQDSVDPQRLARVLEAFLQADYWEECRYIVEGYPELLRDDAKPLIDQWVAEAERHGDNNVRLYFMRLSIVLSRCREEGVERAFTWAEQNLEYTSYSLYQAKADNKLLANYLVNSWKCRSLVDAGNDLLKRYSTEGDIGALFQAVNAYEAAVRRVPIDSPNRPVCLNALGRSLMQSGRLDEAVDAFREAVRLLPIDSPDRPNCINNLGVCLRARYDHTHRSEDLEEAIRLHKEALE